jgi:hypothetical protein
MLTDHAHAGMLMLSMTLALISNAVVTAMMRMFDIKCIELWSPHQLAHCEPGCRRSCECRCCCCCCCAAGHRQSEPRSLHRYLITCSMTITDGQHDRTHRGRGQVGSLPC